MALISVTNVTVLNNPAGFCDPFQFEITFECEQPLQDDIEWKITYVGSAEDEQHDQVLDTAVIGPVPQGCNRFVFEAQPPNPAQIPAQELLGVTVVLITCSFRDQEFIRVGYYVNNEYSDLELRENPPPEVNINLVTRNILDTKPRVTRYQINWDGSQPGDLALPVDLEWKQQLLLQQQQEMQQQQQELIFMQQQHQQQQLYMQQHQQQQQLFMQQHQQQGNAFLEGGEMIVDNM